MDISRLGNVLCGRHVFVAQRTIHDCQLRLPSWPCYEVHVWFIGRLATPSQRSPVLEILQAPLVCHRSTMALVTIPGMSPLCPLIACNAVPASIDLQQGQGTVRRFGGQRWSDTITLSLSSNNVISRASNAHHDIYEGTHKLP